MQKLHVSRKNRIKRYILNSKDENIIAYNNIINSHDATAITKPILKKNNISISNKLVLNYSRFSSLYKNTLLNNINIQSTLNNFFSKFYNIPKISSYANLKKYFTHYKIRTKKLIYSNQKIKKNKSVVWNKNYSNNNVVDVSEFVNMYGFR